MGKTLIVSAGIVAAVINAVFGAVVALNRARPNHPFWTDRDWLIFLAIAFLSSYPLVQSVTTALGDRRGRKKAELAQLLHELLAGPLVDLHEIAGTDWKKTGVQVFRVRRWWVFAEIQSRLVKIRMSYIERLALNGRGERV